MLSIGKAIASIRKEHDLTQEAFGAYFYVTRQTVSNWENEKNYPDLQTLVQISDTFHVSLDSLIKEDETMIAAIDKERLVGAFKKKQSRMDMFTGSGTGLLVGCLFAPISQRTYIAAGLAVACILIGWYLKARYDKKILKMVEDDAR